MELFYDCPIAKKMIMKPDVPAEPSDSETEPDNTFLMYFVYILKSLVISNRKYVGITDDPERRLSEHNNGQNIHTNKFKPWKFMMYIAFDNQQKAQNFEHYLKSHSGRAFAKKHL